MKLRLAVLHDKLWQEQVSYLGYKFLKLVSKHPTKLNQLILKNIGYTERHIVERLH